MNCLRVFFEPDPHLPDDITFDLKSMYVDRSNPENVRLKATDQSYMGGSVLNLQAVNAIRYGFARSREDASENKFYIEKELKTDDDFREFYKLYEFEHHNDDVERTLATLNEKP